MTKYYNKEVFNFGLDDVVGEVHLVIEAIDCSENRASLRVGLANKNGIVYTFDNTYIMRAGDTLHITSDNIKSRIVDWIYYI